LKGLPTAAFFSWYGDFAAMLPLDNSGDYPEETRFNLLPEVTDSFTSGIRTSVCAPRARARRGDPHARRPGPLGDTTVSGSASYQGSLFVTGMNALRVSIPANSSLEVSAEADSQLDLGLTVVRLP